MPPCAFEFGLRAAGTSRCRTLLTKFDDCLGPDESTWDRSRQRNRAVLTVSRPTQDTIRAFRPRTGRLAGHRFGHCTERPRQGRLLPVEQVRWLDAVKCCNALSKLWGLPEAYSIAGEEVSWQGSQHPGVRLPTEAEWEYACRAGTVGDHAGNLDDMAWYGGNSGNQTHPVAQKKPNAWGLYDMHGNVQEWCWDWYGGGLPQGNDPVGPPFGTFRVTRGGSWYGIDGGCRSPDRYGVWPGFRCGNVGFRPALALG